MPDYLAAAIDRIEGDFIILKVPGDQELYWPKNAISFNYSEGDAVNIRLSKDEAVTEDNTGKTKAILRQIFQTNV